MQTLSKSRFKAVKTMAKINMLLTGDVPAYHLQKDGIIAAEDSRGHIRLYDTKGNAVRVSA